MVKKKEETGRRKCGWRLKSIEEGKKRRRWRKGKTTKADGRKMKE